MSHQIEHDARQRNRHVVTRRKEHIQQLLARRVAVLRPLRQLVRQHIPLAADIAAEPLPAATAFQLLPLLLAGLLLRAFRLGAALLLLLLGWGPLPLRPLEGLVDALLRPGVDVAARVAESAVAVEEAQTAEEEAHADARFGVAEAFEEFDVFRGVGEE